MRASRVAPGTTLPQDAGSILRTFARYAPVLQGVPGSCLKTFMSHLGSCPVVLLEPFGWRFPGLAKRAILVEIVIRQDVALLPGFPVCGAVVAGYDAWLLTQPRTSRFANLLARVKNWVGGSPFSSPAGHSGGGGLFNSDSGWAVAQVTRYGLKAVARVSVFCKRKRDHFLTENEPIW